MGDLDQDNTDQDEEDSNPELREIRHRMLKSMNYEFFKMYLMIYSVLSGAVFNVGLKTFREKYTTS